LSQPASARPAANISASLRPTTAGFRPPAMDVLAIDDVLTIDIVTFGIAALA
jgi:hypothetical protein